MGWVPLGHWEGSEAKGIQGHRTPHIGTFVAIIKIKGCQWPRVPKRTQGYPNVPKDTQTYPRVPICDWEKFSRAFLIVAGQGVSRFRALSGRFRNLCNRLSPSGLRPFRALRALLNGNSLYIKHVSLSTFTKTDNENFCSTNFPTKKRPKRPEQLLSSSILWKL